MAVDARQDTFAPGTAPVWLGLGTPSGARSPIVILSLGLLGSVVIPRSGFPVAVPLGYWLLRRARALAT